MGSTNIQHYAGGLPHNGSAPLPLGKTPPPPPDWVAASLRSSHQRLRRVSARVAPLQKRLLKQGGGTLMRAGTPT